MFSLGRVVVIVELSGVITVRVGLVLATVRVRVELEVATTRLELVPVSVAVPGKVE